MPSKKQTSSGGNKPSGSGSGASTRSSCRCRCSITGWLKFFAILFALVAPIAYVLEQRLESFYVFDTEHLHDLQKRAISAHGNDTKAIVKYIVDELNEREGVAPYINNDEEWVFNNAGGAMGAMYIIHASVTEYLIIFGKLTLPKASHKLVLPASSSEPSLTIHPTHQVPPSALRATLAATPPTTTSTFSPAPRLPTFPANTSPRSTLPGPSTTLSAAPSSSTRCPRAASLSSTRAVGFLPCSSSAMPIPSAARSISLPSGALPLSPVAR